MKKVFILLAFILVTSSLFSQTFYGKDAYSIVPGSEMVIKDPSLDIPTFIRFSSNSKLTNEESLNWLKDFFKISSDFDFVLIRSEKDKLGMVHQRFQQTYKGYPIHSNIFIIHEKNNLVTCMNGKLFSNLDIPVSVTLTEQDALKKAISYVGAEKYMWQLPEEEKLLKYSLNDENATYYPNGVLMLVPTKSKYDIPSEYRLAYKFDIYAQKPLNHQWIFVDATTGQINKTLQRLYSEKSELLTNATGTAVTKYNGTRTFTTDYTGSTYRLRETGRGLGIETYDMNTGTTYSSAVDFTDADNNWSGTNANMDEVARDAHWGAEVTYDYYYNKHDRNSINNAGLKLLSYVHYDAGYANAFWDGTRMSYGDGDGTYDPFTTLDICGHEITHGLTEYSAALDYQDESGALNEGFSDVFGTSIEYYGSPPFQAGNWTVGEDIGSPFRNMANPNQYSDPDTYEGTNWYTGTSDYGGVHTNSGVLNFWYYLLCQGGSGTNDNNNTYSVIGITMDKAELIAFRTLTVYLTNSSQYADARTYSIQSAIDLFGSCSQEVQSTTNAWYAVGIGSAYSAMPTDAEFSVSIGNICSGAPVTAQFDNMSTNANSYIWYFGDGSTSNLTDPAHTYTANGTYTVKLVAHGGTCGTDSIMKNAYITIGINATNDTICGPGQASLTATGAGTMNWYNAATGGNLLATGNTFTTPAISNTTTYYVDQTLVPPHEYVGKTSKNSNATLHNNNSYYLIFSCYSPVVLKSVKVYAGAAGNRIVQLKNSAGTTLQSATVYMAAGESRVTLNFNIPVGTNMRLACGTSDPNMYRDISGITFPYVLDNKISITGTNAGTSIRYYYYYDWEIESPSCTSARTQATATVLTPAPVAQFTYTPANLTINFTNTSTNGTSYYWNFGDGSTSIQVSPSHTFPGNGNYSVMLVASNNCTSDTTYQSVQVTGAGYTIQGKTVYTGKANTGTPVPNPPTYIAIKYAINNVIVILKNYPSGTEVARDTSDAAGIFQFSNVTNGNYILSYDKYTPDTMQWGNDISAVDVALVKYYIGADTLTDPTRNFSAKYKKSANVDNNSSINAIDIARLKAKVGSPYSVSKNFTKGNWASFDTLVTIAGADLNILLRTICYGDFNASSSKYRDSLTSWTSAKSLPQNIIVQSDDFITTDDRGNIEIPLKLSNGMDNFSALGLELKYPEGYTLTHAYLPKVLAKKDPVKINPTLDEIIADDNDLLVTDENDVIRVVYATTNHIDVAAGDDLIVLGFKSPAYASPGVQDFTLSGTGVVADMYGKEDDNAYLIMPKILLQGNTDGVDLYFTGRPNPFSNEASLAYSLPEKGTVVIKVYNALGALVSELVNAEQESGKHSVVFSQNDLPSGIYTFRLDFTGKNVSKCMTVQMVH